MEERKRFRLSTVITVAILVGFVGFGFGFNANAIEDFINQRFTKSSKNLPEDLDYAQIETVYDALRQNFAGDLDINKLLEATKRGLVKGAGDAFTVYLTEEEAKQFEEEIEGSFSGIGAEIAIKNDRLVIVAPLAGTPAKVAGLQAGDHIIEIDGQTTEDMSVEEAVAKIRGPAGSQVNLTIVRGNDPPQDFTITRAVIEVPNVSFEIKESGVGYIKLARFGNETANKLRQAVDSLKNQGASKFVIDLRDNPGGLLDSSIEVADEFLDVGQVVIEERKDNKVIETFRGKPGGALVGAPVIVLMNEGSASASEIVAGALKDNGVAKLVGEPSFGKGSVQELVELDGKNVLKVTVALWYSPSGRDITKQGIEPDVMVELSSDDFSNNRDPQLQKALELLTQ